jgi:CheY-like chemotaxis protein
MPTARPRVLVVDDDLVNLVLASEVLSQAGVEALLAGDGAEAVALANELDFDLILMDLQMPVLDGFAATRQIRHFERTNARARVPVVAYTSSVDTDPLRLQDCGIDAVLDKPCDPHALRACVSRWC